MKFKKVKNPLEFEMKSLDALVSDATWNILYKGTWDKLHEIFEWGIWSFVEIAFDHELGIDNVTIIVEDSL